MGLNIDIIRIISAFWVNNNYHSQDKKTFCVCTTGKSFRSAAIYGLAEIKVQTAVLRIIVTYLLMHPGVPT